MNFENEVSRNIPEDIPSYYYNGDLPILTAYGCILLERDTGKSFIYTAVSIKSGKKEILRRSKNPLLTSNVSAMIEKICNSSVVGAGQLEADRAFGEKIEHDQLNLILENVFKEILPQHGYNVRTEQIELAEHILNAITRRKISLAEAEVGTGKTLAYLVPAILAKRGRINDDWNMNFYPEKSYVKMAHMPIVVATSSIALQKALVTDYIPELSNILMAYGVIKTPLTAVIRKGRSHYICDKRLQTHFGFEHDYKTKKILRKLLEPNATIDLGEVDGLTDHVKRIIRVPSRCNIDCSHRNSCSYLKFREQAKSPKIDIQVCNHNYLLADILNRADGRSPLISDYQSIIIDEAHKFLSAAQSMYGTEILALMADEIREGIDLLELSNLSEKSLIQKSAVKLRKEMKRLFRELIGGSASNKLPCESCVPFGTY